MSAWWAQYNGHRSNDQFGLIGRNGRIDSISSLSYSSNNINLMRVHCHITKPFSSSARVTHQSLEKKSKQQTNETKCIHSRTLHRNISVFELLVSLFFAFCFPYISLRWIVSIFLSLQLVQLFELWLSNTVYINCVCVCGVQCTACMIHFTWLRAACMSFSQTKYVYSNIVG